MSVEQISVPRHGVRTRDSRTHGTKRDIVTAEPDGDYPNSVAIVGLADRNQRLVLIREKGRVQRGLPGGIIRRADGSELRSAAQVAARHAFREQTGYTDEGLEPLMSTHLHSSRQTNTAFCFLATDIQAGTALGLRGADATREVMEIDLVEVLSDLRGGSLVLGAVHVAALWSAAARIAADTSERFDVVGWHLRQFFAGHGPLLGRRYVPSRVGPMSAR